MEAGHVWTFLTNHAHVLICIQQDPCVRLRDVAQRVGITERAVQRIVHDLQEAGYVEVEKEGRRNHYSLNLDMNLRHPMEGRSTIRQLLQLASPPETGDDTE